MLGPVGAIPLLPGQKAASALNALYPVIRGFSTALIAILGMLLFGMVGGLAYPGVGAIVGSILGLLICLSIGCCITGFWRDITPSNSHTFGAEQFLPHALAVQVGSHGHFDLIITVHEAKNVEVQGRMPWMRAETYVEVVCGQNPVKRTCIRNDGKFNEQFKLKIAPSDDILVARLKDQDVFGVRDVGYACVDIQKDIIEAGFPWQKSFTVQAGEHDALRWSENKAVIILSFDYTEDYPAVLREGDGDAAAARKASRQDLGHLWKSETYGAVNYLSKLEFNPSMRIFQEPDPA